MAEPLTHEIELYPLEAFKTLLEHEVHRSRRYKHPLTLIHIAVTTDPNNLQTQHSAEVFAINVLNLQLRDTDIPCRTGSEFLILMPATDKQGGLVACDRLEKLFRVTHQTLDRVSFQLSVFIGMASENGEASISSRELLEQAAAAMQHARTHQLQNTVIFSEI